MAMERVICGEHMIWRGKRYGTKDTAGWEKILTKRYGGKRYGANRLKKIIWGKRGKKWQNSQRSCEGVEYTSKFVRASLSSSLFALPFRAPFSCNFHVEVFQPISPTSRTHTKSRIFISPTIHAPWPWRPPQPTPYGAVPTISRP